MLSGCWQAACGVAGGGQGDDGERRAERAVCASADLCEGVGRSLWARRLLLLCTDRCFVYPPFVALCVPAAPFTTLHNKREKCNL